MTVVLDSSAVLAMLWSEPGAKRVETVLPEASICAVNQAELVAKLYDRGANAAQVAEVLGALDLNVLPFDGAQAEKSGGLRPLSKQLGLSLGDRCCLATALQAQARVLTADRSWADLEIGVEIEVIR